jgi:tetratricopeptide (TPR) repeat protein
LLRGEEHLEEALEVTKQGLVIDPGAKDLYNALGGTYSDLGRHDEAIAMCRRYVELGPEEPNAHDSLGMSYQWAGRYDEAIQEYEVALSLNPEFEVAIIHLANTYVQQGRYRDAITQYPRYVQFASSDFDRARGYNSIAQVHRMRGKLDEAERAAKKATKYYKTSVDQLLLFALERGDLATARKLEDSLEGFQMRDRGARGFHRQRLYYRGYFDLKTGRTAETVEHFKEALKHRPPIWNIDPYEDCLANAYTLSWAALMRPSPNTSASSGLIRTTHWSTIAWAWPTNTKEILRTRAMNTDGS